MAERLCSRLLICVTRVQLPTAVPSFKWVCGEIGSTRYLEVVVPKGVKVQVLSDPPIPNWTVSQLVESRSDKANVSSSILLRPTNFRNGSVAQRMKHLDTNQEDASPNLATPARTSFGSIVQVLTGVEFKCCCRSSLDFGGARAACFQSLSCGELPQRLEETVHNRPTLVRLHYSLPM